MAVKLGNGNWAVKEDKLLAYNDNSGKFFNKEFDFSRGSSATYVAKDGLIKSAASDVPRIDFSDSTNGALLLEPQSTNLVNYSQDFSDSSWVKSSSTITPNTSISPDGTLNGSKLIVTSTGALLESSQSLSAGTVYTISAFVKKGTNKFVRLAYSSSSQTGAWFNLEDKTVGTVNSTSATINDYGNGWYRITNTLTSQVSSGGVFLGLSNTDGATGNSVSGNTVYVYGFQIEQKSYATSYIPTSGSATTRLAENAYKRSATQAIGQSEGTMYIEFVPKDISTFQVLYQIRSSSGTVGQVDIRLQNGFINAIANDGGSNQFNMSGISYSAGTVYKVAVRYKLNDSKVYINGSSVGTDTSCSFTASSLDQVSFGENIGSFKPIADISDARLYNTALTDEQLAALTTI